MIVHQLDEHGYYIGPVQANLSPLDLAEGREVWAIPAGCVERAPPKEKKGYQLRWQENRWIQEKIKEPEPVVEEVSEVLPVDPEAALVAFLRGNPGVLEKVLKGLEK